MITLLGNPLSTNMVYRRHGHFIYIKDKARELKKDYQKQAKEQWKEKVMSYELKIRIRLYFGDRRKRDWDNYHKLSMDALTGIVWEDDSLIQEATVEKYYDKEKPRTEIEIYEMREMSREN
jgi:crossover junction endodeoxyribonuclease RusA